MANENKKAPGKGSENPWTDLKAMGGQQGSNQVTSEKSTKKIESQTVKLSNKLYFPTLPANF
jgi:hypothetical protein